MKKPISKPAAKKDLMSTAKKTGKTTLLLVGGLVGGKVLSSVASKALNKSAAGAKLNGLAGFEVSKMITPVVLIAAGIAGNHYLKNEDLKLVATGVAAAGTIDAVSVLIKKDVLTAFGSIEGSQLSIEPYNPELPAIEDTRYIQIEDGKNKNYDAYTEVGSVIL